MGVWSLPDGESRYRLAMQHLTTTDMDPDEVHELGLQGGRPHRGASRRPSPSASATPIWRLFGRRSRPTERFFATSRRANRGRTRAVHRPDGGQAARAVRPATRHPARGAAGPGVPGEGGRGSRVPPGHAGRVPARGGVRQHRRSRAAVLVGMEAVAYHEGVPGHHLQVSIAAGAFRAAGFPAARLLRRLHRGLGAVCRAAGEGMGFYEEDYSDFGRLSNELLRAVQAGARYRGAPQALDAASRWWTTSGPIRARTNLTFRLR